MANTLLGMVLKDRYHLLEKVGSGGFSSVYLARDTKTGMVLAMKILHDHLAEEPHYISQFFKEAEKVKLLKHRNIIQVLDEGEDQGLFFMAIEYVQGKTLAEILREKGPLPAPEAVSITKQAAEALQEAEARRLVHQDIKSQNLMITTEGVVKVMDFGIARDLSRTNISSTGFLAYTPRYASPEQLEGKKDIDIRSDLYSLGIVLFEMLTKSLPYPGDAPGEILRIQEKEAYTSLRAFRQDLPPWVEEMCWKLLAYQRRNRYQNPSELLRDIAAGQVLHPRARRLLSQARPVPRKPGIGSARTPIDEVTIRPPGRIAREGQPGRIAPAGAPVRSAPQRGIPVPPASPSPVPAIISPPTKQGVSSPISPLIASPPKPVASSPAPHLIASPSKQGVTSSVPPLIASPSKPAVTSTSSAPAPSLRREAPLRPPVPGNQPATRQPGQVAQAIPVKPPSTGMRGPTHQATALSSPSAGNQPSAYPASLRPQKAPTRAIPASQFPAQTSKGGKNRLIIGGIGILAAVLIIVGLVGVFSNTNTPVVSTPTSPPPPSSAANVTLAFISSQTCTLTLLEQSTNGITSTVATLTLHSGQAEERTVPNKPYLYLAEPESFYQTAEDNIDFTTKSASRHEVKLQFLPYVQKAVNFTVTTVGADGKNINLSGQKITLTKENSSQKEIPILEGKAVVENLEAGVWAIATPPDYQADLPVVRIERMAGELATTKTIPLSLRAKKGVLSISIQGEPSSASFSVFSESDQPVVVGLTPTSLALLPGSYALRVESDGYNIFTSSITIVACMLTSPEIALASIPKPLPEPAPAPVPEPEPTPEPELTPIPLPEPTPIASPEPIPTPSETITPSPPPASNPLDVNNDGKVNEADVAMMVAMKNAGTITDEQYFAWLAMYNASQS